MQTNAVLNPNKDLGQTAMGSLRRTEKGRKTNISTRYILAALVLFATLMSVLLLSRQSLRLDEAQSLWQSSRSPSGIFYVVAQDVHVPLYQLLLHFWQAFFGNGISQVRIFSLLFFLGSIPMAYLLGRTAYSRKVGLFAAILISVSPFLNWYANEARMYSMLLLITMVNQYFFIKLFKDPATLAKDRQTSYWWLYGISALVGIYTHYFFWLILATQAVFFLFYNDRFPKGSFRKLAFIGILLLVAIVPWLYYVRSIGMSSNAEPILNRPTSINFFNTFSQLVFGFQGDHLNTLIVSLWPLSVLFAFLSLRKHQKIKPETVYFFLTSILPVVLAFVISFFIRPLFLTRYLILTVPSLYLFLSWFLTTYSKKLSSTFKTALVLLMLLTLANQVQSAATPVKENYEQASQYLEQNTLAQDVIIVSAPFTIYPIEYYYNGPASLATLPIWDRFKSGAIPAFSAQNLPQEVEQLKGSRQRAFLVLSYNQGYENSVKNYFDTHFERLEAAHFSQDLDIYVYKLRYDDTNVVNILNPTSTSTPDATQSGQ